MPSLSVKVDHIAAVRNVKKAKEPAPSQAAVLAELAGADGITCHLREDRKYIRDRDFYILKEVVQTGLTLQIAPDEELLERALEVKPAIVTLMPFSGDDSAMGKGIDLANYGDHYAGAATSISEADIKVCYFIDPDSDAIKDAARVKAHAVEFNMHDFTMAGTDEDIKSELNRLEQMAQLAEKLGMKAWGGNGLDYKNIRLLVELGVFERFTIGYAITSRAVLIGMDRAVRDMLDIINHHYES
ncbi:MAG: pyridoxine 5'-phosphate synthase [candidate division Zixibacteria bacterium HGW-Zixibacteria-1]|nr:MAG: pyridoxine 5'-phosphate synthase [candidate division Zixibacteria bacterium HGW-Zixibacteria-1]